jgi:flavin reductase (DIM6/NTAB) family NADH-FMN oxidoreductase RutF
MLNKTKPSKVLGVILAVSAAVATSCVPEKSFKPVSVKELREPIVKTIADDWLLVSAGNKDSFNLMTASWGEIGHLWGEPVLTVFIRPQRYTYQFMENSKYFTVTVFAEQYREILNFCGTRSGRDCDKVKETGLIPLYTDLGNVYYEQGRLVIECEKIYADDFKAEKFVDSSIAKKIYPNEDFHRMYIGKIVNVWTK